VKEGAHPSALLSLELHAEMAAFRITSVHVVRHE
jgi:hypothetical protein